MLSVTQFDSLAQLGLETFQGTISSLEFTDPMR
jgi:hypothetical protein